MHANSCQRMSTRYRAAVKTERGWPQTNSKNTTQKLCFTSFGPWPRKISMRTLNINLITLIQKQIYKNIQTHVMFVKKVILNSNFHSITREIRSEFSFFNENDTFLDFLIDF